MVLRHQHSAKIVSADGILRFQRDSLLIQRQRFSRFAVGGEEVREVNARFNIIGMPPKLLAKFGDCTRNIPFMCPKQTQVYASSTETGLQTQDGTKLTPRTFGPAEAVFQNGELGASFDGIRLLLQGCLQKISSKPEGWQGRVQALDVWVCRCVGVWMCGCG